MNFLKSVFLDDEESSSDLETDNKRSTSESPTKKSIHELEVEEEEKRNLNEEEASLDETNENPSPKFPSGGSGWNFGGLIKTFASKSESVLQTYRQDLEDFSSGLKKETSIIREVASRVVKELPTTFESGTTVAQESLESVGQAIDDFGSSVWRGTAQIISQGKDTLLSVDVEGDSSDNQQFTSYSLSSKKYNRFEAQLYAIQTDSNTYCEDPEDLVDFNNWKSGFVLGEKSEEIENLLNENEVMERVYIRIVPSEVDDGTFWFRYFYKVYKLKQMEDARVNLVKRAISGDEEEDLSWDVDDDEEEANLPTMKDSLVESEKKVIDESQIGSNVESVTEIGEKSSDRETIENRGLTSESMIGNASDEEEGVLEGKSELSELNSNDLVAKIDEKLVTPGKSETGESGKDSDFSIVSSQPSLPDEEEEEDLSWDEIEDLGNNDEKKVSVGERTGLAKRLSVADEDEDLSWDIEDEDNDNAMVKS